MKDHRYLQFCDNDTYTTIEDILTIQFCDFQICYYSVFNVDEE